MRLITILLMFFLLHLASSCNNKKKGSGLIDDPQIKMEALTRIITHADGRTEPQIVSGTSILLIQDGKVSVGKLVYEKDSAFSTHILHPKNEKMLNELAIKIITEKKPEYLKSKDAVIVICPEDISIRMSW